MRGRSASGASAGFRGLGGLLSIRRKDTVFGMDNEGSSSALEPDTRKRIVLVSGSRKWTDKPALGKVLAEQNPLVILHGACSQGTDLLAWMWAETHGIQVVTAPAPWARGRKAGPERNAFLLELTIGLANHWSTQVDPEGRLVSASPVLVAAPLPGGRGTQNMLRLSRDRCVESILVPGSTE